MVNENPRVLAWFPVFSHSVKEVPCCHLVEQMRNCLMCPGQWQKHSCPIKCLFTTDAGGQLKPHPGLHLPCCLPRQSSTKSSAKASHGINGHGDSYPQALEQHSGEGRETVRGARMMEKVRKDWRNSWRGKEEAKKKSTNKTSQPENTALGIPKHFQPVRK